MLQCLGTWLQFSADKLETLDLYQIRLHARVLWLLVYSCGQSALDRMLQRDLVIQALIHCTCNAANPYKISHLL